jgi:hypothetical protein
MEASSAIIAFDSTGVEMASIFPNSKLDSTFSSAIDFSDLPEAISEEQFTMGERITKDIISNPRYKRELDKAIAELRRGKMIARPKRKN